MWRMNRADTHQSILFFDIELKSLFKRIIAMGYTIEMDEQAKDFILRKGWDAQYGARPLKRAIQQYIENDLADEIIKADVLPGDSIRITIPEGTTVEETERLTFIIEKGDTSRQLEEQLK